MSTNQSVFLAGPISNIPARYNHWRRHAASFLQKYNIPYIDPARHADQRANKELNDYVKIPEALLFDIKQATIILHYAPSDLVYEDDSENIFQLAYATALNKPVVTTVTSHHHNIATIAKTDTIQSALIIVKDLALPQSII